MKGSYEPDTFTESDVLRCLDMSGAKYKVGRRYILSTCPLHDDSVASAQIYRDDWFVQCHAGCGRFHITKAFPELRDKVYGQKGQYSNVRSDKQHNILPNRDTMTHEYKKFDLMDDWKKMALLPESYSLHGVPASVLNDMGWRQVDGRGIFIPYFSADKERIPFAQYRHSFGARRFTFLKDAKPQPYGMWNLDNHKIFLVEGTSDCAVLEYAAVPYVGLPSAASGELMRSLCQFMIQNEIRPVYAGDNDAPGEQLRTVLDECMTYRTKQPPKQYKDWGEFLEATDLDTVRNYCFEELFPGYGKTILALGEVEDVTGYAAYQDVPEFKQGGLAL